MRRGFHMVLRRTFSGMNALLSSHPQSLTTRRPFFRHEWEGRWTGEVILLPCWRMKRILRWVSPQKSSTLTLCVCDKVDGSPISPTRTRKDRRMPGSRRREKLPPDPFPLRRHERMFWAEALRSGANAKNQDESTNDLDWSADFNMRGETEKRPASMWIELYIYMWV